MEASHQNQKPESLLTEINGIVENYIRRNLDKNPEESVSNIAPLHHDRELKSCWEINNCSKKSCPSYENSDYRCWLQVGTLCGGVIQGDFTSKHSTCFNCPVFQQYKIHSNEALYENIAILIQHLNDKSTLLREMAIRDNLTRCYNRHYLEQISCREQEQAKRKNTPLSLALFDLNHFKTVNDTYGHHVGDMVLVEFSRFLKESTRENELVFRIGGDEFLLLMSDCSEEERIQAEERLLCCNLEIALPGTSKALTFSFSVGGATAYENPSIEDLIQKADEMMYRAKRHQTLRKSVPAVEY